MRAWRRKDSGPTPELAKVVMSPMVGTLVFRLIFDDRRSLDKRAVLTIHLELIMRGLLA